MPPAVRVRALVVTWDAADLLPACLDSLEAQTVRDQMEIVVVDNASKDGTAELVAERYPDVRLVRAPRNLGFAGGAHLGLADLDADYAVLLNNDARFAPDAVERLMAELDSPGSQRAGAATAKIVLTTRDAAGRRLVNSTGNIVTSGGTGTDRDWLAPDGTESTDPDVFGFCGGAAMLRRAALDDVGDFDPSLFLYYEDTDLSFRLRSGGWTVRYVPSAVAEHDHAASSGTGSAVFRYYNTRNSLIVMTRHAPWPVVLRTTTRQLLGLVRAALTDGVRSPGTGARARGLRDHLARLGRTLAERRRLGRDAVVDRSALARLLVPARRIAADPPQR
ncbi:glycosyltransferase family 2 protein [Cellulomonas fengjieae]|uniref:Glycosyltransferase family 2 protein n=1 Tax=Cellulomonas fengjieae TaxID=2819978 RepID=A0ABS3SDL9_9CELL|nr:glycosyltransferase family 2 protein [Cellulomonas fengjieae]MBO3083847.1 glycosyltransferase family 2 protein [Cellulomonas fengjieae]QVI64867.1 glycosyltransferase family 2 protein [Cellulomonas fengjieae]